MRKRKIKSLKNKKSQKKSFGKLERLNIYGKTLFTLGLFGVIFASSLFTFGKITNQPNQPNQSGQDTIFTDPEVEKVAREVLGDKVVDVLNEDNTAENQKLLALADEVVAQQENGEEVKIAFENKPKKGLWGNLLTSLIGKPDTSRDEEELRREVNSLNDLTSELVSVSKHSTKLNSDNDTRLFFKKRAQQLTEEIKHQRTKIEAIQKRINDKRMQPLNEEVHSYEIEISKKRQKIEQMRRTDRRSVGYNTSVDKRSIGRNASVGNEKIQISQNRRCPSGKEWHVVDHYCMDISKTKAHCERGGGIWHGSLQTGITGCSCLEGYYWNGSKCEKKAKYLWDEILCEDIGPGDYDFGWFTIHCN
jgi:hypothetical protein